jgi:fucose permease
MAASDFRARVSVGTVFFINGMVLASWVPHIPAVKAHHAISDGQLGLVLLSMAVGALLALPQAGWLVGRFGSRLVTSGAALGLCLMLPLPVLAPNVPVLSASLVVFGALNATLDVAMNAQAVVVEQRYRRAIMSSFHGLFSLGGLVGAALAGGTMALGAGDVTHVVGAAAVATLAVIAALPGLRPSVPSAGTPAPVFARPRGVLLTLGMLAFCGLVAEGAMGDWSAVYLHDVLGSTPALASAGFAATSLAMAAGRFGGDRLVVRFGAETVLRTSAALAAIGLSGALAIGTPWVGVVGCGLVGLGIANVIPILFSAAGRVRGVPAGTALAAVATTGYLGFLAGPPVIGAAADVVGLRLALGVVSGLCAAIALGAGVLGRVGAVSDAALAAEPVRLRDEPAA